MGSVSPRSSLPGDKVFLSRDCFLNSGMGCIGEPQGHVLIQQRNQEFSLSLSRWVLRIGGIDFQLVKSFPAQGAIL